VPAVVAPELNDEVTEAVQNLGVVVEIRCCLNVSDGAQPSLDPLELTELFLSDARMESAVSRAAL
jgi:hypothetical protein